MLVAGVMVYFSARNIARIAEQEEKQIMVLWLIVFTCQDESPDSTGIMDDTNYRKEITFGERIKN